MLSASPKWCKWSKNQSQFLESWLYEYTSFLQDADSLCMTAGDKGLSCMCVCVCAPEFSEACLCASAQLICRAKLFWPWARSLVKNVDVLLVLRVRIYASQLHRFSQLFILIWILSETSLTHYLLDIIIRADALLTWQSLVLCACDSVLSCCMFAWRLGLEWLEKLPRHCKGHCYHTPHYPQLHTTLWCARTRCSLVTQPFKLHSFPV